MCARVDRDSGTRNLCEFPRLGRSVIGSEVGVIFRCPLCASVFFEEPSCLLSQEAEEDGVQHWQSDNIEEKKG
jgi:hypothetical protein